MKPQSEKRIGLVMQMLPISGVLILFALLLVQIFSLFSATNWVDHTDRVIAQGNLIEKQVVDLETGVRGFTLTGVRSFLAPYENARAQIAGSLATAKQLVADNPVQVQRLLEVERDLASWFEFGEKMIRLKEAGGDPGPRIATGTGKKFVDRIQVRMNAFTGTETMLRNERIASVKRQTGIVILISVLILFGTAALSARIFLLRRHWEAKLSRSQDEYRALFESSPNAILAVDDSGVIRIANSQAQAWFGYTSDELVGKTIEELIPERYRSRHVKQRLEYSSHPQARPMGVGLDLYARRKDGSEFPVDISLSPGRIGEQEIVTATIRDITDRKRVEIEEKLLGRIGMELPEIRGFEARLKKGAAIVSEVIAEWCGVLLLDPEGNWKRLIIAAANPHAREIASKISEIPGEVPPGWRGHVTQRRTFVWSRSEPTEISRALPGLSPQLQREMATLTQAFCPLESGGKVFGAMIFASRTLEYGSNFVRLCEEITRRVALHAENERLYEETKHAVQAREDTLAIVSHDLKNPVSAIRIATDVARKTLQPGAVSLEGAELLRKLMENIGRSANQADHLIIDLLAAAKIESGTFELQREPIVIQDFVDKIVDSLRGIAQEKELTLEADLQAQTCVASLDRARIEQVLSNLIGNAIKFTDRGGKVAVSAACTDRQLVISVSDTGCGIPREAQAHLFDRYYQVRGTRQQGTGLGLFIVRGIVQAHGGSVTVQSQPGRGSRFVVQLPLRSS